MGACLPPRCCLNGWRRSFGMSGAMCLRRRRRSRRRRRLRRGRRPWLVRPGAPGSRCKGEEVRGQSVKGRPGTGREREGTVARERGRPETLAPQACRDSEQQMAQRELRTMRDATMETVVTGKQQPKPKVPFASLATWCPLPLFFGRVHDGLVGLGACLW